MNFATCQWSPWGELFLAKSYPHLNINFERLDKLKSLLDQDILRIQNPDFHNPAQIIQGTNYNQSHENMVDEAIKQLVAHLNQLKKRTV